MIYLVVERGSRRPVKAINWLIVFFIFSILGAALAYIYTLTNHHARFTSDAQAGPSLILTQIPSFGSSSNNRIAGRVTNISTADYKNYSIGLVVHIEGLGHYSKPLCNQLLTTIASDGTWSVLAVSGSIDERADRIIVFLLLADSALRCVQGGDDISSYERAAVARIDIERDDPAAKTITWSGLVWRVRDSRVAVEPGQTIFDPENVSVDNNGFLHLRTRRNQTGGRTGSEIISKNVYGRGRYIVEVVTAANVLPTSTVFGAYTWGYTPANAHRELDIIEFSRFGNPNGPNAGVGAQPDNAQNYRHFNLPLSQCSRHEMSWESNRVRFLSFDCAGNQVHGFDYDNPVTTLMDEHFRLNLWSLIGSNDLDAEVIVKSVRFIPEPAAVLSFSSADYSNGHGLASDSIVAAFSGGVPLATSTQIANSLPLPTTLGGTTVKVRDSGSGEHLAELLFVSPTQINFIMPSGLAPGVGSVTVNNGNGVSATGTIRLSRISAGLFTADASGSGLPAAVLLHVLPGGTQQYEPIARFNAVTNKWEPLSIDINRPGTFYLVLFGTGWRQRPSTAPARVLIGDQELNADYLGPQGNLTGLDQINLSLPFGFSGRGEQPLVLLVDGQIANKVLVTFR